MVVHARKKVAQERYFARAPLSTPAIALDYLECHEQSKIFVSEIQSFLLLKQVKCLSLE